MGRTPHSWLLTAVIASSLTFSTLTKAIKAAELDLILGNKGEFTIFAPTDEAFGKLPWRCSPNSCFLRTKEKLRSLRLFHVVPGRLLAADLIDDLRR